MGLCRGREGVQISECKDKRVPVAKGQGYVARKSPGLSSDLMALKSHLQAPDNCLSKSGCRHALNAAQSMSLSLPDALNIAASGCVHLQRHTGLDGVQALLSSQRRPLPAPPPPAHPPDSAPPLPPDSSQEDFPLIGPRGCCLYDPAALALLHSVELIAICLLSNRSGS